MICKAIERWISKAILWVIYDIMSCQTDCLLKFAEVIGVQCLEHKSNVLSSDLLLLFPCSLLPWFIVYGVGHRMTGSLIVKHLIPGKWECHDCIYALEKFLGCLLLSFDLNFPSICSFLASSPRWLLRSSLLIWINPLSSRYIICTD